MLSMHWIRDIEYYLRKTNPDFRTQGGEPPGEWWGEGAAQLGLVGTIRDEDMKAIAAGFAPDGTSLIRNAGSDDHQQGWDGTFSAPKSLSVLWSQVSGEYHETLEECHDLAVKKALGYLQDVASYTRRGKAGEDEEKANGVVGLFKNGSNCRLNPHLHTHCTWMNVCTREDGTTGAIVSRYLYEHKMTAGAIYQAELDHQLRLKVGLETRKADVGFELVGVSRELCEHHSEPAQNIRKMLRTKGYHSQKAAEIAALDFRKKKNEIPPARDELHHKWRQINKKFGLTDDTAANLVKIAKADTGQIRIETLVNQAIESLQRNASAFTEQQLIRSTCNEALGKGVATDRIIETVKGYLATQPHIIPVRNLGIQPRYTTERMLALEKQVQDAADRSVGDARFVVDAKLANRIANKHFQSKHSLTRDEQIRNEEQKKAVLELTTRPGTIQVLEGLAGTGKTYTLSVARKIWEKAGYKVIGMTLAATAARTLEQGSGIKSATIAKRLFQMSAANNFRHHHKRQLKRFVQGKRTYAYTGRSFKLPKNCIVVIDEAAMVGTEYLSELIKHIEKAKGKLVLVGDAFQLQPINAGSPFRSINRITGRSELNHVIRQKLDPDDPMPEWHREAGKLIRWGHAARAMQLFAERDRLQVTKNREDAILALVRDWTTQGLATPIDHIILAGPTLEVDAINRTCQAERLQAGQIQEKHAVVGDNHIHVGDVVLFTLNAAKYDIDNGDRGVVRSINKMRGTMEVYLPRRDLTVIVSYRHYTNIELGYAMTTHKFQGGTAPSCYVLLGGPMQDRHLSYVQTSRAVESTRLYIDKRHAGPELKHIIKHMDKAKIKVNAHELLDREHSGGSNAQPVQTIFKHTQPGPDSMSTSDNSNGTSSASDGVDSTPEARDRQASKSRTKKTTSADKTSTPEPSHHDLVAPESPRRPAAKKQPRPRPLPKVYRPRDLCDLSHVNIVQTNDSKVLEAAIDRYGKLPGGIVVEGKASCSIPIESVRIDEDHPSFLLINDSLRFDTGLSREELVLLWNAVVETDEAEKDFGALTQHEPLGVPYDSSVAMEMMTADNFMGYIVYGVDSQHEIAKCGLQGYRNPFLEQMQRITDPSVLTLVGTNWILNLSPQFFVTISDAEFCESDDGFIFPFATKIMMAIGVIDGPETVVTERHEFASEGSHLIASRFPWVYDAFRHFARYFRGYSRTTPELAKCIAFAEVVLLLRNAKADKALLHKPADFNRVLAGRQRYQHPRFDFTLISDEYAAIAARVGRQLYEHEFAQPYEQVIASLLATDFAARAKQRSKFSFHRKKAVELLEAFSAHAYKWDSCPVNQLLYRHLPRLIQVTSDRSQDIRIEMCMRQAFYLRQQAEMRAVYLMDIVRMCEREFGVLLPTTQCILAEVNCIFHETMNPTGELAVHGLVDGDGLLPYRTLKRILLRRAFGTWVEISRKTQLMAIYRLTLALSIDEVPARLKPTWDALQSDLPALDCLMLLADLQRCRVTAEEFLERYANRCPRDRDPWHALSEAVFARLQRDESRDFDVDLLHRNNPFRGAQELFARETEWTLRSKLGAARKIEVFGTPPNNFAAKVLRAFTDAPPQPAAQKWWIKLGKAPTLQGLRTQVLIAYELCARNRTVECLYEKMLELKTQNPQLALFALDLGN